VRVVRAQQHDTVDEICYREFGRTAGVTEQTLALAENHGLADHGPRLPQGTPVTLPDIAAEPEQKMVQLWT
tara:strand:+ start:150 stop:362 length:213 start_codon:yes stop_codon:yes gene_type:complete